MDVAKGVRKFAIDYAVNLLVDKQIECNGTIPSSFYSRVLDGLAGQQIFIQRNALQQRVNRERAKRSYAKEAKELTTPTSNPRAERFSCTRADWTCYETIEDMYNRIYPQMVDAGVAEKRTEDSVV